MHFSSRHGGIQTLNEPTEEPELHLGTSIFLFVRVIYLDLIPGPHNMSFSFLSKLGENINKQSKKYSHSESESCWERNEEAASFSITTESYCHHHYNDVVVPFFSFPSHVNQSSIQNQNQNRNRIKYCNFRLFKTDQLASCNMLNSKLRLLRHDFCLHITCTKINQT